MGCCMSSAKVEEGAPHPSKMHESESGDPYARHYGDNVHHQHGDVHPQHGDFHPHDQYEQHNFYLQEGNPNVQYHPHHMEFPATHDGFPPAQGMHLEEEHIHRLEPSDAIHHAGPHLEEMAHLHGHHDGPVPPEGDPQHEAHLSLFGAGVATLFAAKMLRIHHQHALEAASGAHDEVDHVNQHGLDGDATHAMVQHLKTQAQEHLHQVETHGSPSVKELAAVAKAYHDLHGTNVVPLEHHLSHQTKLRLAQAAHASHATAAAAQEAQAYFQKHGLDLQHLSEHDGHDGSTHPAHAEHAADSKVARLAQIAHHYVNEHVGTDPHQLASTIQAHAADATQHAQQWMQNDNTSDLHHQAEDGMETARVAAKKVYDASKNTNPAEVTLALKHQAQTAMGQAHKYAQQMYHDHKDTAPQDAAALARQAVTTAAAAAGHLKDYALDRYHHYDHADHAAGGADIHPLHPSDRDDPASSSVQVHPEVAAHHNMSTTAAAVGHLRDYAKSY